MISPRWRTLSVALGALCAVLMWRDCSGAPAEAPAATAERPRPCTPERSARAAATAGGERAERSTPETAEAAEAGDGNGEGAALYGVRVPDWVIWLAPHPGEDLRVYRDRMLPLAIAAIAPQRARVANSRDAFAALARLDARQRAELDAAAQDTAAAVQDRVLTAVLGGELAPAAFKPMLGVGFARDLLDIVARGNRRFVESLHGDQRASLARHPFDFGDYLVFSTRWEDALRAL